MENLEEKFKHINGWGIDADPENDPTYPMKNWTGADHQRIRYERPPQQPITVEVLHSNERPSVSSVFGTTVPPAGISGRIRRFAFNYSESTYLHWVPLVLADRVAMVEGIVEDIKKGHFPNFIAETGWTAEWKYNRKGLIKNVATGLLVTTALAAILFSGKKKK